MNRSQPIAGVVPLTEDEVHPTTVWPSLCYFALGRWLGRLYAIRWPNLFIFRLGHCIAGLCIPIALNLYLMRVGPFTAVRYVLTSRRIRVLRGMKQTEQKSLSFDRFDEIRVVVREGQEWYHAGDLIFYHNNVETFRLEAVSRPEIFRRTCLEARTAYLATKKALEQQGSAA